MNLHIDLSKIEEFFMPRFGHHFARIEVAHSAIEYIKGLLSQFLQQSNRQVEETMGASSKQAMQRLLYGARWDEDAVLDDLQRFINMQYGDEDGIIFFEETSVQKRGDKSVGVQRQYNRSTGKVENCRIGVFLFYSSHKGCTIFDRRMYLPKACSKDRVRREKVKVPSDVKYTTRPDLVLDMLQHAINQDIPFRWIAGNATYGDNVNFRGTLNESGNLYVLGVSGDTLVSLTQTPDIRSDDPTQLEEDLFGSRHANSTKDNSLQTVADVVNGWSDQQWKRLTLKNYWGNPYLNDWARGRVVGIGSEQKGEEIWLLACRSVGQRGKPDYFLSNAYPNISLEQLARVVTNCGLPKQMEKAGEEIDFRSSKVRYWHSWHRHTTLSMIAVAWLCWAQQQLMLETHQAGRQQK